MKKYWGKFKTIFSGGALMIAGLLVLSACTYSEEEKALIAEYEARGQEYALRYAEEKYGFVPEIVGVDFDTYGASGVPDPTPPPNGWVYVDMSDGTEEFQVYVNAQGDSGATQIDACDNYQREEIREAVKQQINAIVPMEGTYCEIKETTMSDASKVIVYVDKKQIASKMKDDRAMFVTESLKDGEINYRSESTSDFGTVILSQIRIRDKKDIKFSVFTDDRTDE